MKKKSKLTFDTIPQIYSESNIITLYNGDCKEFLNQFEDNSVQLIVTSPPYNVGKEYEKRMSLDEYLEWQGEIIDLCVRKLAPTGSICWQVGNYIEGTGILSESYPLDILLYPMFKRNSLKLRNRIIWTYGHGLHASYRFSGRHETILWFTKSDDYIFNLDDVRIPQKYPGKKGYKGSKAGDFSGNPLGKNPSDVWVIPNVKGNHVEKTDHPCQFPLSLVKRLIKALTNEGDIVVDPFMGVGTTPIAAMELSRRGAGSDYMYSYYQTAKARTIDASNGVLRQREDKPVYEPKKGTPLTINPFE
ncbi:site-specific DNA-methyltransferase [Listeria newyorkensis]|uniref:Methyltransferase n=2 Tax=Listeria newyorkensis TaxID=1497681 RepID=A0A841YWK8_9LIST|nr:site-specific DNA-methyltransferase [Listeria newyorkensis]